MILEHVKLLWEVNLEQNVTSFFDVQVTLK